MSFEAITKNVDAEYEEELDAVHKKHSSKALNAMPRTITPKTSFQAKNAKSSKRLRTMCMGKPLTGVCQVIGIGIATWAANSSIANLDPVGE